MSMRVLVGTLLIAATSCSSDVNHAATTPMQKVVQILNAMHERGKDEKHREAVQYAAYKQFCDDHIASKTATVTEEENEVERLKAMVQKYEVSANTLQKSVRQIDEDVATFNGDLRASQEVREAEAKDYTAAHRDYTESIDAVGRAVLVLKEQAYNRPKTAALLTHITSLNKVPMSLKNKIMDFLSDAEQEHDPLDFSGTNVGYESRSQSVIDMLEKLQDKFVDERSQLEREELKKKHSYELVKQSLEKSISNNNQQRGMKVQLKSEDLQKAATHTGERTDVQTSLTDDKKYLTQLQAECTEAAREFDERQNMRGEELETLDKAIEMLSNDNTMKLLSTSKATVKTSFTQLRATGTNPSQLRVAKFLSDVAQRIDSRSLSVIATKARDDPFAKVKKMVQDLITRLKEQANEEAQHKEWCDAELTQNEQVRSTRTSETERLSTQIDSHNAEVNQIQQQIAELSQEVVELDNAATTQTQIRKDNKASNEATLKDCQDAQIALRNAITLMKNFYAEHAEGVVLLNAKAEQRRSSQTQAPPLFTSPYQGAGGEQGVVSVLETVMADFARLESETSASEITTQQDYDRFMRETQVDKAVKQTDIKHRNTKKSAAEAKLVELQSDLSSTQKELETANQYYDQLKPSCLNQGTGIEERNARRQEEIESLQEAMRILNGEEMGPNPLG